MVTLLNFVTVYAALSLVTLILFIVVEVVNAQIKGPEYALWLMRHRPENLGPLTVVEFLGFLLLWPVTAVALVWAMLKGRSLIEHMYRSKEETQEKAEAEWKAKVEEALPLTAKWHEKPDVFILGIRATVHAMLVEYPEPGKVGKKRRAVSHVVFSGPGRCVCLRATSRDEYLPCASTDTLNEALTTCYLDKEWLRALAPGHERELAALASAMKARAATDPT